MSTATQNRVIPEKTAARKTGVAEIKAKTEFREEPFRPRATLLLDIEPAESEGGFDKIESPEESLRRLLFCTEASARRTQSAKLKWQATSLVMGMLLTASAVVIGWLYFEMNMTGTQRGRLAIENKELKDQLNTSNDQIAGFKGELGILMSRNVELANENTRIKSQGQAPSAAFPALQQVVAKAVSAGEQMSDTSRIEAIKKGTYPKGTAKEELTAVLGKPDRIYQSRGYEQYVYFDKKPGRFWFGDNGLVRTSG